MPRPYCHIGTGNYHARTARLYRDLGLLTSDREIGADVINLFHFLTGHAPDQQYRAAVVAPRDMRRRFLDLIVREVERHREAGGGRIIAKLNALDDAEVICALYEASRTGVAIDLIVRSHCRLRPRLPGFSETIRVVSIVGRFLEHDRIYYFHNGGDPIMYIGSGDWRERNLDRRVELAAPVRAPELRDRLTRILQLALDDRRRSWELLADGTYLRREPAAGEAPLDFHEALMRDALERARRSSAPVAVGSGE